MEGACNTQPRGEGRGGREDGAAEQAPCARLQLSVHFAAARKSPAWEGGGGRGVEEWIKAQR